MYGPMELLSDVGGYCGLFLGVSFLSFYDAAVSLKIKKKMNAT